MSGCVCPVLSFTTPSLWELEQSLSPLRSCLTLSPPQRGVNCANFTWLFGGIQQDDICGMPSTHTLCVQTIFAPLLYRVFQSCLATWNCSFPAESLVFSTTSVTANLLPLAILVSSCCSAHLWSQRMQEFSLKKHIQILPQPLSSHMGNWVNNSRPPLAFLTPLFLSALQTCVDWVVSVNWTIGCAVLEKALDWEPRGLDLKSWQPHSIPSSSACALFCSVSQRVPAFLNQVLLPNPRIQRIVPRMVHN